MTISLSTSFDSLADRLAGEVITPDHPEYETARRVWNGMIDRHPAAIARCAHADDVAVAVRFARESGLPLAVRGNTGGRSRSRVGTWPAQRWSTMASSSICR